MTMAMQKQYCGFKSLAAHLCIWSIFFPPLTVNKWSSSDSAYKINFLDNILENFVMTESVNTHSNICEFRSSKY